MIRLPSIIQIHLGSVWRRKWIAALFCWAVCLIGWAAVAMLPNRYESQARIYADVNSLLTPLLHGIAVSTDPDRQLEYMQRTLLSRANLEQIAHLANIGPSDTRDDSENAFLERLARNIEIRVQSRNLFVISYADQDPVTAKNVVQGAITVFSENTAGNNRQQMDSARSFVGGQIAKYERELRDAEAKRAAFREKYANLLPYIGTSGTNLDSARAAVDAAKTAVANSTARRDAIKKELATIPQTTSYDQPYGGGGNGSRSLIVTQLQHARSRLVLLQTAYTDAYPDVIAAKHEVAQLEAQLNGAKGEAGGGVRRAQMPNVVYEQIKIKLTDADGAVAEAERQLSDAEARQHRIETALRAAPGVELEAQNLDRDYGILKKNYEELISRRESAEIAEAANVQADKVQFRVINPPQAATQPVSPNRIALDSGVLIVGLAAGLGLALVLAQADRTFGTLAAIRELGLPVLGSVSLIKFAADRRAAWGSIAGIALSAVVLFLVYGALVTRAIGFWGGAA